jgi:hypothetical protein
MRMAGAHGQGLHQQVEVTPLIGECFVREVGTHFSKIGSNFRI